MLPRAGQWPCRPAMYHMVLFLLVVRHLQIRRRPRHPIEIPAENSSSDFRENVIA